MNWKTLAALLLAFPAITNAVGLGTVLSQEFWECRDKNDSWDNVVLKAGFKANNAMATVFVADVVHFGWYSVQGIDRRWDFGPEPDGDGYMYSLIVAPNGDGTYYDFRMSSDGRASPSAFFKCRKIESQ